MRIDRDGTTDCITIHPNDGWHSASVIIMHGLGDTAEGWLSTAEYWAGKYNYIKFILPTARRIPVTINGGSIMPAWHDIKGLQDQTCDGLDKSLASIKDLVEAECALGIQHKRILLAGFSQGGGVALSCGLQCLPLHLKPAGLLIMSGFLPRHLSFSLTPGFDDIEVLHFHGRSDPVVIHPFAEMTRDYITGKGLKKYDLVSYDGLGHTVNQEILDKGGDFIKRLLPNEPSLAIKAKDPSEMSVKELKIAIRNANLGSKAVGLMEKHEFVALLQAHRNEQS